MADFGTVLRGPSWMWAGSASSRAADQVGGVPFWCSTWPARVERTGEDDAGGAALGGGFERVEDRALRRRGKAGGMGLA